MALDCCSSQDLFVIILLYACVIDYGSKQNYYYHRPKYSDCRTVRELVQKTCYVQDLGSEVLVESIIV